MHVTLVFFWFCVTVCSHLRAVVYIFYTLFHYKFIIAFLFVYFVYKFIKEERFFFFSFFHSVFAKKLVSYIFYPPSALSRGCFFVIPIPSFSGKRLVRWIGFRGRAAYRDEECLAFRQVLQLPSSRWLNLGVTSGPLYRYGIWQCAGE